ncbi:VanZ family protein [Priestia megaterium]|jgi:glycopeptide antibiotics resistance protein|uniref:VanZ family protein n=1 Tax=Priestia megaterium TaxID=1404 RepID=UPI002E1DADB5|nr:VanZ family protein [Priestia megaterium]MED4296557.1 VanZ family protein [Priestia megaterium]
MLKINLGNVLFLGSILFIISLTLFPEAALGIGVGKGGINVTPFHTIGHTLFHHTFANFIKNNIGNIILFMPFGFLLPFKFRSINSILKACLVGMLFSATIECVQLFMSSRWTDVDDVILNTIGTGIGYNVFKIYVRED